MDERNRLEGTNAARDKSMSQDSSVLPELAASPKMASTSSLGPAHSVVKWRRRPLIGPAQAHSLDASSPRKIVGKNPDRQDPIQRNCPPPFRDRLSLGPPRGTSHWSIVRVFRSSPPKMGRWHVFVHCLSQGARWGLVQRGGIKRKKAPFGTPPPYEHWTACYTFRHTFNIRLPNNLAKHAFKGGSELILYLITH